MSTVVVHAAVDLLRAVSAGALPAPTADNTSPAAVSAIAAVARRVASLMVRGSTGTSATDGGRPLLGSDNLSRANSSPGPRAPAGGPSTIPTMSAAAVAAADTLREAEGLLRESAARVVEGADGSAMQRQSLAELVLTARRELRASVSALGRGIEAERAALGGDADGALSVIRRALAAGHSAGTAAEMTADVLHDVMAGLVEGEVITPFLEAMRALQASASQLAGACSADPASVTERMAEVEAAQAALSATAEGLRAVLLPCTDEHMQREVPAADGEVALRAAVEAIASRAPALPPQWLAVLERTEAARRRDLQWAEEELAWLSDAAAGRATARDSEGSVSVPDVVIEGIAAGVPPPPPEHPADIARAIACGSAAALWPELKATHRPPPADQSPASVAFRWAEAAGSREACAAPVVWELPLSVVSSAEGRAGRGFTSVAAVQEFLGASAAASTVLWPHVALELEPRTALPLRLVGRDPSRDLVPLLLWVPDASTAQRCAIAAAVGAAAGVVEAHPAAVAVRGAEDPQLAVIPGTARCRPAGPLLEAQRRVLAADAKAPADVDLWEVPPASSGASGSGDLRIVAAAASVQTIALAAKPTLWPLAHAADAVFDARSSVSPEDFAAAVKDAATASRSPAVLQRGPLAQAPQPPQQASAAQQPTTTTATAQPPRPAEKPPLSPRLGTPPPTPRAAGEPRGDGSSRGPRETAAGPTTPSQPQLSPTRGVLGRVLQPLSDALLPAFTKALLATDHCRSLAASEAQFTVRHVAAVTHPGMQHAYAAAVEGLRIRRSMLAGAVTARALETDAGAATPPPPPAASAGATVGSASPLPPLLFHPDAAPRPPQRPSPEQLANPAVHPWCLGEMLGRELPQLFGPDTAHHRATFPGRSDLNEVVLMHGTSEHSALRIAAEDFDERVVVPQTQGATGAVQHHGRRLFGAGTYLTNTLCKAHAYGAGRPSSSSAPASPSSSRRARSPITGVRRTNVAALRVADDRQQQQRLQQQQQQQQQRLEHRSACLVIARVALGEPSVVSSAMAELRRPPVSCDSVVGNGRKHKEFVVYDRAQVLPLLVVWYTAFC